MRDVDILVVGAGPAGLSAAIAAARRDATVLVIDENEKPGGQLFKQIHKFFGSHEHHAGVRGFHIGEQLLEDTRKLQVEVLLGYPVYGIFDENLALYGSANGVQTVRAHKIIIATGANENNLVFPGSTLPGVMTAGAAQTMINLHHVQPGTKVVMVGSGNVGLIVSYQMLQAGIDVVAVVEAAPTVGGYDVHANKLRRAGVPYYLSHTINRVTGDDGVQIVELIGLERFQPVHGTEITLEADTVCMAVGLTPMIELAAMTNCQLAEIPALGGVIPLHDEDMCTTTADVYIAGDISGIEEASTAMEEGRLAGTAAAEALGFIAAETAQKEKESIRSRLSVLRSGEFGQKRADAKEQILQYYYQGGNL